ncbi:MAG: alpha/beta hydrolase, partial [Gemmatimonadetes bacterium]|nr:alpha/beta hydrolase [Gemmatimonadota bacterium]
MKKVFWRIIRSACLIYVTVAAIVYIFQRRLQYLPDSSDVPLPTVGRFEGLKEVELVTSDGVRVLGWYWPGTRPLTIVLFHGNAGHRGHRLDWMAGFHDRGFAAFLLDYRGYGGSGGSPTEEGLYLDATAAVEWLQEKSAGKLIYLGESIGCGVAVEMAVRKPPAALI